MSDTIPCLFLDDERYPESVYGYTDRFWLIAYNRYSFITLLDQVAVSAQQNNTKIPLISLDHDLGDDHFCGMTAAHMLCDYLQDDTIQVEEIKIHSKNPVGAQNILSLFESLRKNVPSQAHLKVSIHNW